MNIGILKCDSVRSEFVQQHGEYPDMFIRLLDQQDPNLLFRIYDLEAQQLPDHIEECDAYIITGSRHGAYEDHEWIPLLENFIRQLSQTQTPMVGICFGHQIICQALGGEVRKSDKGWGIGISTIEADHSPIPLAWMHPAKTSLNLIVVHQDQVIQIPQNATRLMHSDFCPNHMLLIGHNILTIQGHPEFNKDYLKALMDSRRHIIPTATLQAAEVSLEQPTDEWLIGHWIYHFLTQKQP